MMNIDSPMGSQVTYFQTKPHSPGGWWERFGFQKPLVSLEIYWYLLVFPIKLRSWMSFGVFHFQNSPHKHWWAGVSCDTAYIYVYIYIIYVYIYI